MSESRDRNRRRSRRSRATPAAPVTGSPGRWSKAVYAVLAVVALLVAFHGWNGSRNALSLKALDAAVRELESHPQSPDPAQLAAVLRLVEDEARGAGPAELELRGRVWWLAGMASEDPAQRVAEFRQARAELRAALALKPSWPYTWLLLARVSFALDPRSGEGPLALNAALDIGLRGLSLQQQLLELRLLTEGRLEPQLLERVRASFRKGVADHGTDLTRRLPYLDRVEWVCDDPHLRELTKTWCSDQHWSADVAE